MDALSTVDGQCCQDSLSRLDMEEGPNRRCHPSYQHPLGRPLSLTLVNDKGRGEVFFTSTAYKNGLWCVRTGHESWWWVPRCFAALEILCRTKAAYYRSYDAAEGTRIS